MSVGYVSFLWSDRESSTPFCLLKSFELWSRTQNSKVVPHGHVFISRNSPSCAAFINLTSSCQFSYPHSLFPASTIPFHTMCYFLSLWDSENVIGCLTAECKCFWGEGWFLFQCLLFWGGIESLIARREGHKIVWWLQLRTTTVLLLQYLKSNTLCHNTNYFPSEIPSILYEALKFLKLV